MMKHFLLVGGSQGGMMVRDKLLGWVVLAAVGVFGVPPVPWTVYGLGFKPCIAVVAGSVLDISSSRS
jgi:hypothetical protein